MNVADMPPGFSRLPFSAIECSLKVTRMRFLPLSVLSWTAARSMPPPRLPRKTSFLGSFFIVLEACAGTVAPQLTASPRAMGAVSSLMALDMVMALFPRFGQR